MGIVEVINESLRLEVKKLIWFSLNNDYVTVNSNKKFINSKVMENFDNMNLDELLLFRKNLLELNNHTSFKEISDCYNSALSDIETLKNRYLKALIFVVIASLALVLFMYKVDILFFIKDNKGEFHLSIREDCYVIGINFYYYAIALISVMSRIVFEMGQCIPHEAFFLMRIRFFVFSLIWPLVLILIYNMSDIGMFSSGVFNDSLFFSISGWAFYKFFKTMVSVLNGIETSVSQSLLKLTKNS